MKFSKLQKAMADIKQKAPISVLFAVAFLGLQTPAFAVDSDNDGLDDSVEGTSDVDNDGTPNSLDTDSDGDGIADTVEAFPFGIVPPPSCGPDGILIAGGEVNGIDLLADTFAPIHTFSGVVNATGYNPHDELVWGYSSTTVSGILFDPQTFAIVDTFPNPENRTGGDINISNKTYVAVRIGQPTIVLDADPNSPTYLTQIDTYDAAPANTPDIVFDGNTGLFYGIESSTNIMRALDPATGTWSTLGAVSGLSGAAFGAAYATVDGKLFFGSNTTGDVYMVDTSAPGFPSTISATLFAGGPIAAQNDGYRCSLLDLDGTPILLDADDDGIPDYLESTGDTDGDGTPDYLDLDSDGDGVPDATEGLADADGDGLVDYLDVPAVAPVATADSASVASDTIASVNLADNVSDADNDLDITTIDLDPSTPGIDSTLTTADGVWSVGPTGALTFDPVPAFEGTAVLPYTVSDAEGTVSAPADVTVTVAGATPIATADTAITAADTNVTVALANNVSDANNDVDITTIDLDPSTPGIDNTLTTPGGSWSVNAAGVVTFNPAPFFEGTATIPYTVADDDGNVSAPANVSVTVAGAPPVATPNSATTATDTNVTVALASNVSDVNNDVDIATIDLDPSTPGIDTTLTTADGVWTVDPAGVVTFDPDQTFEGTAEIPYVVSDDDGNVSAAANVSVTVAGAAPVATAANATTATDTNVTVALADNVSDANYDVDITTIDLDPSTPGIDTTVTTPEGVWTADPTGVVTFDPAATFEGTATIDYVVSDDDGNVSAPSTVSVTVDGAFPIATNDTAAVLADVNAVVDLSDNISDGNNDEDVSSIDLEPETAGQQTTLTTPGGVWTIDAAGMLTFDPIASFEGTASLSYTVTDDDGNVSAPAVVTVTVGSDTDGNGTPDFLEVAPTPAPTPTPAPNTDSDGDGIPDSVEGTGDKDGDGIPDFQDEDSDNDSIPDSVEAGAAPATPVDTDGDALPDYLDVDADNDGISDAFELADDTDGDGVENFRDLDVDNDGIFDLIEARIGLTVVNQLDTNNDGIVDQSNAYGTNGMANIVETTPDSGVENYTLPDIDGDGVLDWQDLDSDNDGLLDTEESDHTDDNLNGIIDTVAAVRRTILVVDGSGLASDAGGLPRNTDGDGLADFRDPDSDNDGIMDVVESFGAAADADNDGMLDDFVDADGDGVDDNFQANPSAPADTDGDGIADASEIDADSDGISDLIESGGTDTDDDGTIDGFVDTDVDGVDDTVAVVPSLLVDTDGDGSPDFQDPDSDNDGLTDLQEGGGTDIDGDGLADNLVPGADLPDADDDGIPDFQEILPGAVPTTPVETPEPVVTPEPEVQTPEPADETPVPDQTTGIILTGLQGTGCAISPTFLTHGQGPQKVDPTLPMISMLALMGLVLRRRSRQVTRKAGKSAGVAVVAIGSLFLSSCSTLGIGQSSDDLVDYEDSLSFGLYAAAGIGPSRIEPDTSQVQGVDPNDRVEPAGQVTLGVDLHKWLSLEGHSADLGSAGLSPTGRINYHVNGLSALVYAGGNRSRFRRQGLTAFGRIGVGALDNSPVGDVEFERVNDTHVLIGAGIEYMTPFGLGLRAEGISFDEDARYAQLALMYRTGLKKDSKRPVLAAAPEPELPVVAAAAPPEPLPVPDACDALSGVLEGVTFHNDSAGLTDTSSLILNGVADTLATCERIQIEISAHTDSVGSESYNQSLSERRAQTVVDYLSERGLSSDRLNPTAFGESSPIDDNATAEGRARNRRVELYAR